MILDEHWSPFSEWAYQRKCVQFLRVFCWLYPLPVFTLASFHLLSLPSSNCQAVWLTHLRDFINLNPRKLLIMHGLDGNASSTTRIISTLLLSQLNMPSPLWIPTNHQTPTNSQSYLSAHSTDSPSQFHAINSTISTYLYWIDLLNSQETDVWWHCVISDFRREVDGNRAFLGYYAASGGNLLPTFRDKLSVPSSGGQ